MTATTMTSATRVPTPSVAPTPHLDLDQYEGWQALAVASLGRPLSDAELAAAECLPVAVALDLLFPELGDAARHEALCALG